jgi:hypothetical protein
MQDFYAHSTWVDDPARRDVTWFAADPGQRLAADVWSCGHFCALPRGRSPHGKVRRRVSPETLAPARPRRVFGSRLAARFVELEPAGMTLDAPWMTAQTAVTRGFRPEDGQELFEAAHGLALRTSERWLRLLDDAMGAAGHGRFWRDVRTARLPGGGRAAAFESPAAIAPFMAPAGCTSVLPGRAGDASGLPGPADHGGRWFGLARLRYARGGRVVPLGPWPALPDRVDLAATRPAAIERVEVFAWQRPQRGGNAVQGVSAGLVHDSARDGQPVSHLRIPLDRSAVRELSTDG